MPTKRNSNIELLRIFAMIMIIAYQILFTPFSSVDLFLCTCKNYFVLKNLRFLNKSSLPS